MTTRPNFANLAIFAIPALVVIFAALLVVIRSQAEAVSDSGVTAYATLVSPEGDSIGTVGLIQGPAGVLVQVDAEKLTPGGHAFIVHEVGMCAPDFDAAGGHFDPKESDHGFIHPSWRGGEALGSHGGDLPNIYAAADGTARADFFTEGFSLDRGSSRSLFDGDGSSIVIYEKADAYEEQESENGARIACGVIYQN